MSRPFAIWCISAPAVLAASLMASPATASNTPLAQLAGVPLAATQWVGAKCEVRNQTAGNVFLTTGTSPNPSKSSAILGGELSALDQIRMQQEGQIGQSQQALANSFLSHQPEPASDKPQRNFDWCWSSSPTQSRDNNDPRQTTNQRVEFLDSQRVPIANTVFDNAWDRVAIQSVSGLRQPATLLGGENQAEIASEINRWVNNEMEYVEDKDLFGEADFWAGARLTLALGRGDCEDFALTKMQLLAANGFSRRDMYLLSLIHI